MPVTPIFDPKKTARPMRVAAFMSGSGTNIKKLIEKEKALKAGEGAPPFEVIFVFSDRSDGACAGEKIALDNGLPYFSYDTRAFHRLRSVKRTVLTPEGMAARKEYDQMATRLVKAFEIDVIALGGYMSYITLNRCLNVHPADLSIRLPDGRRKYVGDYAVRDAIAAGEKTLRASTLWTDKGVDTGPLLMISEALSIELPQPLETLRKDNKRFLQVVDEHQKRLKKVGDWKIFPLTIEMIARGRFGLDEDKRVYVDGKPVPNGYKIG
ncbi:MAG: formyl transferase [Deltaproteobacteria bacterium]|nr:formyl transferase [Deltaproteobacteria bacterium]